jgi:hypothetical protein
LLTKSNGVVCSPLPLAAYKAGAVLIRIYPRRISGPDLNREAQLGDAGNALRKLVHPQGRQGPRDDVWDGARAPRPPPQRRTE